MFIGRNMNLEPGPIYVSMTGAAAAFFMYSNSGKAYNVDLSQVDYLAYDCDCDYGWVPSDNGATVSNALLVMHGTQAVYFGKLVYASQNRLGKVGTDMKTMYFPYGFDELSQKNTR